MHFAALRNELPRSRPFVIPFSNRGVKEVLATDALISGPPFHVYTFLLAFSSFNVVCVGNLWGREIILNLY